ncbi:hypothetical protein [Haloterrigena salinisoli]|uniref:hypothetical protein n=1 Tax=Haloterrigena salinisoli TaxID=3132747 RepID=UPI0030D5D640
MADEPRVATERERLETMLIRQYIERLEALDAETERLLESIAATESFDEPTRARARRHLREIRAQLHALLLVLRDHPHATDELRDST